MSQRLTDFYKEVSSKSSSHIRQTKIALRYIVAICKIHEPIDSLVEYG